MNERRPRRALGRTPLFAAVMVALFAGASAAHASTMDATPLTKKPSKKKRPTARVRSVKFDAAKKRYVVRATIALSTVRGSAAVRAKTSLKTTLDYAQGGQARKGSRSVKLSSIKIIAQDAKKGLATVEIHVPGAPADKKGDLHASVELVGANPTPHP